jgi:hypothetical protein
MRFETARGGLGLALIVLSPLALGAQEPTIADVLDAAGGYLLKYSAELSTIAAEEEYTQREPAVLSVRRRLHSDVVLVGFSRGVVKGFRDIYNVDGTQVRERDDRLLKLLQGPPTDWSQSLAMQWWDEGARHYLSPNLRTLDFPTIALDFLRRENQPQSKFSLSQLKTEQGVQIATIGFEAGPDSRVLPGTEGSRIVGRAWIQTGTGTIRQTELQVSDASFSFRATTKYALEPSLGLWLPSDFLQVVDIRARATGAFSNMGAGGMMGARQTLEARATYSKFRRGPR